MTTEKLSFRTICIITGTGLLLTSAIGLAVLYFLTKSVTAVLCGLLVVALAFLWVVAFVFLVRNKVTVFSFSICRTLDNMLDGHIDPPQVGEQENLLSKINHRLTRLYEVMRENRRRTAEEKAALQELISDISHQVKTPVANLKIVAATLLEQDMPIEKQQEFLQGMSGQLDKLDFLMQSMIKTSRLETGLITLEKKEKPIYDTLAAALGGILLAAEKKNICVSVSCPEDLGSSHDQKWTTEALFNILDNAVKYTPEGGKIAVTAQRWEMYLKIDIADTGKGILESRQPEIFKRFYREEEVHDIEGIGIGLYLAREIITMQGGYIKVTSETGKGSVFSVFLPNR